ncbi:MAG: PstS family phosphate ABC transporter substrate-binding protein [Waterburya sp.]
MSLPPADRSKTCPKCKFDLNPFGSKNCQVCGTALVDKQKSKIVRTSPTADRRSTNPVAQKLNQKANGSRGSKTAAINLVLKNKTQNWLNYVRENSLILNTLSQSGELKKTTNFLGLLIIGLMIMLWVNYLFLSSPRPETKQQQKSQYVVPQGLFGYGGAPIFAPLVASGMNIAVEQQYPGFETRYTKPINGDFSVDNAIDQLINNELSFVFSDRPLNDSEYQKAKLRSFSLANMPIALDGIVFYANTQTPVARLNREQVAKIFLGQINNWNQIDSRIKDMPVTPVVVRNDQVPGIEVSTSSSQIEYTDNYTLALRKVIGRPGAISFASASLVQNQQLVKMLALAEGGSQNFVRPWSNRQVNLKAFKDGSYPLTRRVFLIYRRDSSLDQKAGEFYGKFLKSVRGQQIIQKAGFVSIY